MAKKSKITNLLFITLLLAFLLTGSLAQAQEINTEISNNDLKASSLATKGGILKFLNDLQHTVRYLVTWNPLVKTKMELTKANESLIIARAELAKSQENPQALERFEKAINRYSQEMAKINNRADKLNKEASENPKLSKVLDQYIDNQLKQQVLLKELTSKAPAKQKKQVENAKENALNGFANVLNQLDDKNKIDDRLVRIMTDQKDYQNKELRELEILNALEEKIHYEAKQAITKTKEITLLQLNHKLKNLSKEEISTFEPLVNDLKVDSKIQSYIISKIEEVKLPAEPISDAKKSEKIIQTKTFDLIPEIPKPDIAEEKTMVKEKKNTLTIKPTTVLLNESQIQSPLTLKEIRLIIDKNIKTIPITPPTVTSPAPTSQTKSQKETPTTQDSTKADYSKDIITQPPTLEPKINTKSTIKVSPIPFITPNIYSLPEVSATPKTTTLPNPNLPTSNSNISSKTELQESESKSTINDKQATTVNPDSSAPKTSPKTNTEPDTSTTATPPSSSAVISIPEEPKSEPSAKTKIEPELKTEPQKIEPGIEVKPKVKPEPKVEPEPQVKPEPKIEPSAEPKSENIPEIKSEPEIKPGLKTKPGVKGSTY